MTAFFVGQQVTCGPLNATVRELDSDGSIWIEFADTPGETFPAARHALRAALVIAPNHYGKAKYRGL